MLLILAGCGRDEVRYYEVPKSEDPTPAAMELPPGHPSTVSGSMAGMADLLPPMDHSSLPLTWDQPEAWVSVGVNSVRIASFTLEGMTLAEVDISLTRFPGDVGGLFSNVNRWRGQIGLPPLSAPTDLKPEPVVLTQAALDGVIVDYTNPETPAQRVRVAIVSWQGFSWFFKISGREEAVATAIPAFDSWLQTVRRTGEDSQ
jgi:hypothetical protein